MCFNFNIVASHNSLFEQFVLLLVRLRLTLHDSDFIVFYVLLLHIIVIFKHFKEHKEWLMSKPITEKP